MNDKNWSPGTFLPDTISGKELVKFSSSVKMTRAEWISVSVTVASRGSLGPTGLAQPWPGCCSPRPADRATIPRPAQSQGHRQYSQPAGPREHWGAAAHPVSGVQCSAFGS